MHKMTTVQCWVPAVSVFIAGNSVHQLWFSTHSPAVTKNSEHQTRGSMFPQSLKQLYFTFLSQDVFFQLFPWRWLSRLDVLLWGITKNVPIWQSAIIQSAALWGGPIRALPHNCCLLPPSKIPPSFIIHHLPSLLFNPRSLHFHLHLYSSTVTPFVQSPSCPVVELTCFLGVIH